MAWWRKAAEQGHVAAQSDLGYCYHLGLGVTKDAQAAAEWYRRAAEQGQESAIYAIKTLFKQVTRPAKVASYGKHPPDQIVTIRNPANGEMLQIMYKHAQARLAKGWVLLD